MRRLDLSTFPVSWEVRPALTTLDQALSAEAERVHGRRPGNILTSGRVARGDVAAGLAASDFVVEGAFETGFVEHAYIEPEAGFARRVGDRIEIQACTQAPYMDRDDIAKILGIAPTQVRIIPTAVGGGFRLEAGPVGPAFHCACRVAARSAGPNGLFASRIDHDDDQAPSRPHPRESGRDARRAADGDGFLGRLQYGRLRLLGSDRRQSRAGACLGPLSHAALSRRRSRGAHPSRPRRRLSRVRRAAGRGRTGAAVRRTRRAPRPRQARVSHPQRVGGRRRHGHRPGLHRRHGFQGMPRGAATALARGARGRRFFQRRRRSDRCGAASASPACGTAAATPRSPIRRRCGSA